MPTPEELKKMDAAAIKAVEDGTHDHRDVVKSMTDMWTAMLQGKVPVEPAEGDEASPSS